MTIGEMLQTLERARADYKRVYKRVQTEGPSVIRAAREAQDISQRQLAAKIGVTPTWVNRLEQGNARISIGALQKLAQALGREPAVTVYDEPDEFSM